MMRGTGVSPVRESGAFLRGYQARSNAWSETLPATTRAVRVTYRFGELLHEMETFEDFRLKRDADSRAGRFFVRKEPELRMLGS